MNIEIKEKWIAALKSGEFEQATGKLRAEVGDRSWDQNQCEYVVRETGGYCCLGVLQDVYQKETGNEAVHPWYSSFPGHDVLDWAGFEDDEREEDAEEGTNIGTLTELNDDAGYSFSEVADFIEQNF